MTTQTVICINCFDFLSKCGLLYSYSSRQRMATLSKVLRVKTTTKYINYLFHNGDHDAIDVQRSKKS